jgi:DNA-binding XRE family transcriptional regulator
MSVGVKTMKVKVRSKLHNYLESRGTSKSWLGEQIGASRSQVQNWSKNDNEGVAIIQPSIGYVLKMKDVLDCSVDDLYELKEE